jgi:hypothetical protein
MADGKSRSDVGNLLARHSQHLKHLVIQFGRRVVQQEPRCASGHQPVHCVDQRGHEPVRRRQDVGTVVVLRRQRHRRRQVPGRAIAAARYGSGVGLPACFAGYLIDWLLTLPRGSDLDACLERAADCVYVDCPEAAPRAAQGLTSGHYSGVAWPTVVAGYPA